MHEAVAKVVDDHRRRHRPLAVWRDGQAVWLPVAPTAAAHESPGTYRSQPRVPRS